MDLPLDACESNLDLSKILVYDFHYDYMIQKYSKNNVYLIYMDTDSIVPSIKTHNFFYEDIKDDVEKWFDTSNFDERRRKDHYM